MKKIKRQTGVTLSSRDFLLEIGVEELPVMAVLSAVEQLQSLAPSLLQTARLEFGVVRAFATPRRVGIIVTALAARQRADVQELVGPPKSAAFDASDQPTPACLGFLNKWNANVKDIHIKETPRGPCIMVRRTLPALPAARALGEVAAALLAKLQFPKTMRWHAGAERVFARPIRWLMALYGAQVVPVRLGTLTAGRITRAHRNQGSLAVRVPAAAQYERLLARSGILIDPAARRAAVQRLITAQLTSGERLAAESLAEGHAGGMPLVEEVAHLVEAPAAFRGECATKFAALPREILIASMAKYQRVFAVEDTRGKLLPTFIAVTNGRPGDPRAVKRVYETILSARLSDSLLFYQQDLKTRLEDLVSQTDGILVHRKIGSMRKKTERLVELASWIGKQWQLDPTQQQSLSRAAQLCKADLVTHVVYEFPSLQGIMGGIYLRRQHPEQSLAAEAIADHYLMTRPVPRSIVGIALAVADRVDTLTGFLGIGIKPTGSADPFGLRRAANELLALLATSHARPLSLSACIDAMIGYWQAQSNITLFLSTRGDVLAYLRERFEARQDARYDLVRAVLAAGFDDVGDALARIKALEACVQREPQLFAQACKVSQRTRNIVRAVKIGEETRVDSERLTELLEREVWTAVGIVIPQLHIALNERRYVDILILYARTFSDLLERFFTHVLVNAEDAAVRANRLALLARVDQLISKSVADLTQVVLESTSTSRMPSTTEAVPS